MGECGVLWYLITLVVLRKFLCDAFRKFCDFMDKLENNGDWLEEKLSSQLFTLMKTLIGEHNPLPSIALSVADSIGKLLAAVVVYAGARIVMHLVEKMEVEPSVKIKESVVDPIKKFVSEKMVEYDDYCKCLLVAPIGNYALQKIQKFLPAVRVPFSLLEGIVIVLFEFILIDMSFKFPGDAPFPVSVPIEYYVARGAANFIVIILIQIFVKMSLQNMLALGALLRVEYSIRDVKNFVDQSEHLRTKMTELHSSVDFAKEKSEHIQVNQWLTSVTKFLDESSNVGDFDQAEKPYRDFDQAKNLYCHRPTNTENFYPRDSFLLCFIGILLYFCYF